METITLRRRIVLGIAIIVLLMQSSCQIQLRDHLAYNDEFDHMVERISIRSIRAQETLHLRAAILRPGQTKEQQVYPNDEASGSFHAGAYLDGELIGIASVFHEAPPGEQDEGAWRLRGMAVHEQARRQGIGRLLLECCLEHIEAQGGESLWCNGRVTALAFYQRLGFKERGEIFDVPESGPHYQMVRPIQISSA